MTKLDVFLCEYMDTSIGIDANQQKHGEQSYIHNMRHPILRLKSGSSIIKIKKMKQKSRS